MQFWNESSSAKKLITVMATAIILLAVMDCAVKDMRAVFTSRGKVIQSRAPPSAIKATCPGIDDNPATSAPIVLTFPMAWDSSVGEYLISFSIGGASLQGVPDTGSEYIVVGSQQCQGCDTSQGVVNEDSATAVKTSSTTTISYGSQTDTVQWYVDDFGTGDASSARIEFGAITKVTSSVGSNLNIVGLASSTSYREKMPFLDQLVCTQQVTLPYMYFDFAATVQSFVIGQPHPNAATGIVIPYYGAKDLMTDGIQMHGLNYYFLKPTRFTVNDVSLAHTPRYCMFDTGTTVLNVSNALADAMMEHEGETMILDFGAFRLQYLISRTTMQPMDDFVDDICILGNQQMGDHAWSFDFHNKKLTIIG